jgi:hypothetical protein
MKNKLIIVLVLVVIFAPTFCFTAVPPLTFLTIIVNTEEDAVFHYHLSGEFPDSVDIQTQDLYGSAPLDFFTNGGTYTLSQNSVHGLKIDNIFCVSNNPSTTFFYQPDRVTFTPFRGETIVCTFNNVKTSTKNPVLIVPGLLGTEMKKGNEKLWADVPRMLASIRDEFMDPLSFGSNLKPSDPMVYASSVIRSEAAFDYTENLIDEFADQSYLENETLFTFPYDWRYGVSGVMLTGETNSDLLKEKIDEILQQTGADKVDVVAHSMGGLLVKQYVMENPTDNNIGKAIFVGVPNTGAPKAVKVLLQGDNFGVLGLNDSEIKKISENMPSAYDLLPSQKYYDVKGSFIKTIEEVELTTENPTQQNIVDDLDYQEMKSFLVDDHSLNSLALSGAENLHTQTFDNFDMRTAGVDVYNITGCKTATLEKITEIKHNAPLGSFVEYRNLNFALGDGTVPFESATNLPVDQDNKYYALVADHGKMLSQNGIRQEIVNLISGSELTVLDSLVTQDISQCQLNGKAIKVYSPIDITITDQDGNKLGLASDKSLLNEIPNSDFEVWGDHKFVYLPTDGGQTYNVNINGTDNGIYTIKIEDIQNSQIGNTEVFSNLPVTTALAGQISLSGGATTLILDTNGDGVTDQTLEPSAVLSTEQADDLIPPVSTATIIGEQKKPDKKIVSWLKQKKQDSIQAGMEIEITATDENSGVLDIEYNLDNAGFKKIDGDKVEVIVLGEGEHTIIFFATDKAGNNETEQTLSFEIKENKNKLKAIIFEIKNLIYNRIPIDVSKNKIKFPWNLGQMIKNIKQTKSNVEPKKDYNIPAVPNIVKSLKNKFNLN